MSASGSTKRSPAPVLIWMRQTFSGYACKLSASVSTAIQSAARTTGINAASLSSVSITRADETRKAGAKSKLFWRIGVGVQALAYLANRLKPELKQSRRLNTCLAGNILFVPLTGAIPNLSA